jgi:type VII secretion integral membrane protein EccD
MTSGGLTRVSIVAQRRRVHLAIPADVPLADVLPTLLRHAEDGLAGEGSLADAGAADGGWLLARLDGVPLDTSRSLAQLRVLDGEVLQFVSRAATPPPPVFDDLADAVATATRERAGQWQVSTTRKFAGGLSTLALVGGAVAILFAGPPRQIAALVGLAVGLALLAAAALASRAMGDARAGTVLGLVSLVYGAVGGLLLGGERNLNELASSHALFAATAVVVYSSTAIVAIATDRPVFLAASVAGAALGLAAATSLVFGVAAAGGAAVIGAVAFAMVPALSRIAFQMAGLRVPPVPRGPEDVKNDDQTVDGPTTLRRSDHAAQILTALLGAVGVVIGVSTAVLVVDGGLPGLLLAGVLAVCLMLRARSLSGRAARLVLLLPGTAGLVFVVTGVYVAVTTELRLSAMVGALVLFAILSLAYGFGVAGRRISPVWSRALDIIDVILIIALIPLALWVCGLYGWIGSLGR